MNRTFEDNKIGNTYTSDPNEMCKNCKFIRRLWWWKYYPKDKQYGWCCTLFDCEQNDYTIMQLYTPYGLCEMFTPVNGRDENGNVIPGGLIDKNDEE